MEPKGAILSTTLQESVILRIRAKIRLGEKRKSLWVYGPFSKHTGKLETSV